MENMAGASWGWGGGKCSESGARSTAANVTALEPNHKLRTMDL